MSEPLFLSLEDVLALHAGSLARFGGGAGLRDAGGLESAIATPRATMFGAFLHPSLAEQGAAYLFHLVQNHPFIDGNKRTGLAAGLAFLGLNDLRVATTNEALIELTLGVAQGLVSKAQVAEFFRRHGEPW